MYVFQKYAFSPSPVSIPVNRLNVYEYIRCNVIHSYESMIWSCKRNYRFETFLAVFVFFFILVKVSSGIHTNSHLSHSKQDLNGFLQYRRTHAETLNARDIILFNSKWYTVENTDTHCGVFLYILLWLGFNVY